ncbi:MAG: FAD-dependent oxidoreductase, partial [Myxococcota bacterium]
MRSTADIGGIMDVIVVGDGPGGLSAALFLAKAGKTVTVYGQDKTAMHAALLKNYLGIEEMTGSDFQKVARDQVRAFGASLEDVRVESVSREGEHFVVALEGGATASAKYLILSEGKAPKLAKSLGLEHDDTT